MLILNQRPVANAHVLTVAGKIDARTMGEFEDGIRALMDAGHHNIVVDFAEVPFISSAGLGILMSVIEHSVANASPTSSMVVSPPPFHAA